MRKVTIVLAFLFAFSLLSIPSFAQDASGDSATAESNTKTVTGCLQKGTKADSYSITGDDGITYWLHSKTVKLAEHVGHTVTVTGKESHRKAAESKDKTDMNNEASGQATAENEESKNAHLWVTDLTMVSDTCTPK